MDGVTANTFLIQLMERLQNLSKDRNGSFQILELNVTRSASPYRRASLNQLPWRY